MSKCGKSLPMFPGAVASVLYGAGANEICIAPEYFSTTHPAIGKGLGQ